MMGNEGVVSLENQKETLSLLGMKCCAFGGSGDVRRRDSVF